jgi:hypothetical protein
MKYKQDKHFKFIDFENSELTGIMILMGKYKGVLYHYNKVRVVEDSGIAKLEFGYTLVDSGKLDIDAVNEDGSFTVVMGDILTEILSNKQYNEQIRTDNPEAPDLQ